MATIVVDWRYTRPGCTSCDRARDFLQAHKMDAKEVVDARKNTLGSRDALALAASVDEIYVSKGRQQEHFDLRKDRPSQDELLAVMLGPTGNLRAPIIKHGLALLVGFNPDNYLKVLVD